MIKYTHKERTAVQYSDADVAGTVMRILAGKVNDLSASAHTQLLFLKMARQPRFTTVQLNDQVSQFMSRYC